MSRLYPLLLALFLVASTAAAQNAFQNEIGIMLGVTVVGDGSKVTTVGVPGAGGALGPGALYAARIQRPWIFEAHFSLNHLSGGGAKFTQVYLALQGDYLLSRNKGGVPYVLPTSAPSSCRAISKGRRISRAAVSVIACRSRSGLRSGWRPAGGGGSTPT